MNRRNREKHKEIAEAKEAFLKAGAEGNPDVIDWDEFTIVGTSTRLDKNYLRLTSAPDPSTVRPLHILRQTLEMLIAKWKAEQKYTYICDQFKSLRQDLTVQRIKNEFTVAVYEAHGRIALE
ncbi:SAC3/GANP/Nin1/mts3/eIF-3 p25 family-domain-containing protein, partial [Phlyctochytrium arcticum]